MTVLVNDMLVWFRVTAREPDTALAVDAVGVPLCHAVFRRLVFCLLLTLTLPVPVSRKVAVAAQYLPT